MMTNPHIDKGKVELLSPNYRLIPDTFHCGEGQTSLWIEIMTGKRSVHRDENVLVMVMQNTKEATMIVSKATTLEHCVFLFGHAEKICNRLGIKLLGEQGTVDGEE